MSNRIATDNGAKAAALNTDQVRKESQSERARKEQARRQATKEDRVWRKLAPSEQERRFGSDEDIGLETDGHRVKVDENIDVGAGKTEGTRPRVLTQAGGMHRANKITSEEWQCAEMLREWIMQQLGHSEGVSSYGLSPGRSDPATKANRRGRALTGYEVDWRAGNAKATEEATEIARRNRTELRRLAELLFAMVGVETAEGDKVFDHRLALMLIRSVTETSNAMTLTEIGGARTAYTGEKQQPAAGGAILKELYQRGALHLGLVKGAGWDEKLGWVPA